MALATNAWAARICEPAQRLALHIAGTRAQGLGCRTIRLLMQIASSTPSRSGLGVRPWAPCSDPDHDARGGSCTDLGCRIELRDCACPTGSARRIPRARVSVVRGCFGHRIRNDPAPRRGGHTRRRSGSRAPRAWLALGLDWIRGIRPSGAPGSHRSHRSHACVCGRRASPRFGDEGHLPGEISSVRSVSEHLWVAH